MPKGEVILLPATTADSTKTESHVVPVQSISANPVLVTLKIFLCGIVASFACLLVALSFWFNPFTADLISYYIWAQLWLALFMDIFLLCTVSASLSNKHKSSSNTQAQLGTFQCMKETFSRVYGRLVIVCYGVNVIIWTAVSFLYKPEPDSSQKINMVYLIAVFITAYIHVGLSTVCLTQTAREFYYNNTVEGHEASNKRILATTVKRRSLRERIVPSSRSNIIKSLMPFTASNTFVLTYFFALMVIKSTSASFLNRTILLIASILVKLLCQASLRRAVLSPINTARKHGASYMKETIIFAFTYMSVFIDSQLRIYITEQGEEDDYDVAAYSALLLGACELFARLAGSFLLSREVKRKQKMLVEDVEGFRLWKSRRLQVHLWQVQANMISEYISISISIIARSTTLRNTFSVIEIMGSLVTLAIIQVGIELPVDSITLAYDRFLGHPVHLDQNVVQYLLMQSGIAVACTGFAAFSVA